MTQKVRLVYLFLSLVLLISIGRYFSGNYNFLLDDFWFTSGFLLLILLSLVDQPHFSKDANIFINGVAAGISLLLVPIENRNEVWWFFLGVTIYLTFSSYTLMLLRSRPLASENNITKFFSRLNREIGKPQTLFSAFFLWGALTQFGADAEEFRALLMYWVIYMIVNVQSISRIISKLFDKELYIFKEIALGRIFGVQSRNTFLVRLFPERKISIKTFDFVEFRYSIEDGKPVRKGLVLDSYLLNEQQWIKVLATSEIDEIFEQKAILKNHTDDIIYRINEIPENQYLDAFIGIVTEGSTIGRVRFIYNSKARVEEGQLVEVKLENGDKTVYYQIVEGLTKIEELEDRNETGLIIGEAIQLGTWDLEYSKFEQYGWVPSVNAPLYLASDVEEPALGVGELKIGRIPNTNFPVIIDKNISLTHHTAILGVTGTGKSTFARNLIREHLREENIKVIVIDFTGEYAEKFNDLNPAQIVEDAKEEELFEAFEWISTELEKFGNQ